MGVMFVHSCMLSDENVMQSEDFNNSACLSFLLRIKNIRSHVKNWADQPTSCLMDMGPSFMPWILLFWAYLN